MIAGQLPATPGALSPGSGAGGHLHQPDPGQPGQRRRRRPPLPDGRELPDERLQQHDRQQRVDPRGRRHRHQRRPERAGLQQHDHEEPDDGHRGDLQRSPGAGRPLDLGQQRPAAGHAAGRLADSSATRCCSTTSSGTTGPAPGPAPRSPASASPATPARSTTGIWVSRTAPGSLAPTNSVVQQNAGDSPVHDQSRPTAPRTRTSSRPTTSPSPSPPGVRTRRSSTPRS